MKALRVFFRKKQGTSRLSGVKERRYRQKEFKERLEIAGLEIKVHGNDIERALKILKRELQKEGLFKEIKQRSFYEKPSVKEKRKQREAQKKRRKALRFKRPVQAAAKK